MFNVKVFSSAAFLSFILAACGVDTTGLSAESSRPPHPRSNVSASVLVEEFIDLQCEACRAAQTRIIQPMLEQYGSRIRYEVKYFPIYPHHQYAFVAAEAAECAADQGKFWEFEEMNYEHQDEMSKKALREWASVLQLDMDLFDRCVKSGIKNATVKADQEKGISRGVQGTPTFFVNGKQVESRIDAIGAAIEEASNRIISL